MSLGIIEVPVRLPAAARATLRAGDMVRLRPARHSEQSWSAPIVRIAPEDDPRTRTTTVFVELDQRDLLAEQGPHAPGLLTPGLFLEATATSEAVAPRWVVPRRSLRAGRLLIVEDDRLVSRPATIAFTLAGELQAADAFPFLPDRQWAVLDEPLETGRLIVLDGSTALRVGQVVRPVLVGDADKPEARP